MGVMRKIALFIIAMVCVMPIKAATNATVYEAENGKTVKCESVTGSKYSGGKAIRMTDGSASLTITINVEERQKYDIYVMAEGVGGEKVVNCSVNGSTTTFNTNQLSEVNIGTFIFNAGANTVKITPNWTWFCIDYIRIEPHADDITFDIADKPVTKDCTASAQVLYSFLKDNFGQRTISGMMTGSMDKTNGTDITKHEDVVAVKNASGYYPALVGFDFMNATGVEIDNGNTWYNNYNKKVISLAKDLWKRGGIPDFTWHWRDPSRKTNEFYTSGSKLDFASAFNADGTWNTSSTLYRNIVKDIRTIADCFLELQKADVACIFRPLHEAAGTWFWWGASGEENFKKLYRLVYDEMAKKGVRNVIWDWNADCNVGEKWCPGEEYYDVISTDIYNESFDYSSNYPQFDKLKAMSQGKKIIALAENGPIPDITKQVEDNAMWSWWMPWYQSWDGNFVNKTSTTQWKKCMSNELVVTLEDMKGWSAPSSITTIHSTDNVTRIYDLSGRPIDPSNLNDVHGIVIIKENGKTYKKIIK